jgi:hypothetical protein
VRLKRKKEERSERPVERRGPVKIKKNKKKWVVGWAFPAFVNEIFIITFFFFYRSVRFGC